MIILLWIIREAYVSSWLCSTDGGKRACVILLLQFPLLALLVCVLSFGWFIRRICVSNKYLFLVVLKSTSFVGEISLMCLSVHTNNLVVKPNLLVTGELVLCKIDCRY
jgi:hypothetical protein